LKGRWGQFVKSLFVSTAVAIAALGQAQIGEFLAPGPQPPLDIPNKVLKNVGDTIWHHSLPEWFWYDPTFSTKPQTMSLNVVSDGSRGHRFAWSSKYFRGSLPVALPASVPAGGFRPRGVELYDDWQTGVHLKGFVVADMWKDGGLQPVVIPFIFWNNAFIHMETQYLYDPGQAYVHGWEASNVSIAQDHNGEFLAVWTKNSKDVIVRRFRTTYGPPFMEMVGPPEKVDSVRIGLKVGDVVRELDVAMNESKTFNVALDVADKVGGRKIFVYQGDLESAGIGKGELLERTIGSNLLPSISIAMRTWNGMATPGGEVFDLPGSESDFALVYVQNPERGTAANEVRLLGKVDDRLMGSILVNPTPEEAGGEVAGPRIDGGNHFYEVAWNYLDRPGYLPGSSQTWEVLSQGIALDMSLIDSFNSGNPGHKAISDTHQYEQFGAEVAIALHPKMVTHWATYSYGSILWRGANPDPGNLLNPPATSVFNLTHKQRDPGGY